LRPTRRREESFVIARVRRTRPTCRVLLLAACTFLARPAWLPAQESKPTTAKPPEHPQPKELALSPAAAPVPALKYRLLPSAAELIPGDAAPIYLRIHGYEDSSLEPYWKQIGENSEKWRAMPLDQLPAAEARGFVDLWSGKLKLLTFGTRRKTCDWNYTLPEQRLNAVEILLPDAQSMRQWGRLLAIKARVEIADGRYDDAIRTIETGLAFGRHVGGGPFVINGLIGIAIAKGLLDRADELIAQPGAPNLYWALTALPRPLIDLRDQIELDQVVIESLIPELSEAELGKPRTPTEWASHLRRMHEGIVNWYRRLAEWGIGGTDSKDLLRWNLDRFKTEILPAAREYLKTPGGRHEARADEMCDDQIIALYLAGSYREIRDDLYKASYLPMREALPRIADAEKRHQAASHGPLALFGAIQAKPTYLTSMLALDRQVATLRVIEALRLHAAAHDGKLPESLDQITEVPVPEDPATGKPFIYRRAGAAAILHSSQAGLPAPGPTYRITIRR
jgi:hypothetical protein